MKKLLMTVGVVFVLSANSFAQRMDMKQMDPVKRAEKMSLKLKDDLKLTDAQYASVLKLNTEKANAIATERSAMKEKRDAYKASYMTSMQSILSPDQYKAFQIKVADREEKMKEGFKKGGHRGGRKGEGPDND